MPPAMTDEVDKKNPPAPPLRVRRIVRSASTQTKTEGSEATAAPKAEGGAAEPEAQPGGDKRIFDVRAPRAKEAAERAPARPPAERAAAAPPAEGAAAAPPAEGAATPPRERAAAAPFAGRPASPFAGRGPQAGSDRRRPRGHEPARSGPRPSFSANDPRSSRYADREREQRAIGTTTPEEASQPGPPGSRGPGASKGAPAAIAGDDRAKRADARPTPAAKEPSAPAAKEISAPAPVPSPPPAPAVEPALLAPMPRQITTRKAKKPLTAKEATTARVVARAAKQRGKKASNRVETRGAARDAAAPMDSDEAPTSGREESQSEPAEAPKPGLWKRLLGLFSRSK